MSPAAHDTFGDRVQRMNAPMFVKASDPNAVPAMQVDGPKAGKLVYIEGGDRTSAGGRGRRGDRPSKAEKKPMTLEERQMRHNKRRQSFVVKQVETRLRSLTVEEVRQMLAAKAAGPNAERGPLEAVSLLLAFGTSGRSDRTCYEDPWDRYDRLRGETDEARLAAAVYDVTQIWVRRLTIHDSSRVGFQAFEARRVCETLGIDFAAFEAEAVKALPQPKSWGLPPEDAPQASEPPADRERASTDPTASPEPASTDPTNGSPQRRTPVLRKPAKGPVPARTAGASTRRPRNRAIRRRARSKT